MTTCTATMLHQHADTLDHAAAVGGWLDDRTGQRWILDQPARDQWARDAAVLREHAMQLAGEPHVPRP